MSLGTKIILCGVFSLLIGFLTGAYGAKHRWPLLCTMAVAYGLAVTIQLLALAALS